MPADEGSDHHQETSARFDGGWLQAVKKAPTKKEKAHMSAMAATGCILCEMPAELHHPREGQGVGMRASHMDVIPLCPRHHRHGGPGVAIHAGIKTFELTHGTERELLEKALKRLESYA